MYVDRFLVASVVSAAAAGYYATPSDLLGRFSLVTIAVMNTAFPAMAAAFRTDAMQAAVLVRRCILAIASLLFVPSLVVVAFSRDILTLWIGAAFAAPAAPVMQWLALAVILGAADAVVSGFIDSIGRPDVNAKFSIGELVLYVPVLVLLLHMFGITGAAFAWTLRVGVDLSIRVAIVNRLVPALRPVMRRVMCVIIAATLALSLPLLVTPAIDRLAFMAVALAVYIAALWLWGASDDEKAFCAERLRFRTVS